MIVDKIELMEFIIILFSLKTMQTQHIIINCVLEHY